MDYSVLGANQEVDDQGSVLPGYVPYLSLVFKMITTTLILLLSGWVVYTIKTTTSLHKPYNIFVANLLVSDMVAALLIFTIQCSMMISYRLGVKSLISCSTYKFVVFGPLLVNSFSIVILASDRLVALVFPFMYKRMKTRRVEAAVIGGAWLLAIIPATYMNMFDVEGVLSSPEYGVCVFEQNAYIGALYVSIPMAVASFLTMVLYVLLIVKALQVQQRIEVDKRYDLTGVHSQTPKITTLKTELLGIKLKGKLLNVLLVIILVPHLFLPLFVLGRYLNTSQAYQHLIVLVVLPNITYVIQFSHSLVFGLYFKQVCQPIVEYLKRFVTMNKASSVAPQQPCTAVV